jgi:hypothetical protein
MGSGTADAVGPTRREAGRAEHGLAPLPVEETFRAVSGKALPRDVRRRDARRQPDESSDDSRH